MHQNSWAEQFHKQVNLERTHQEQLAADLFKESLDYHASFDHESAIRTLEKIPEPLRGSLKRDYLERLRTEKQELDDLLVTLQARTNHQGLEVLLPQVERAIALCGERSDLISLRQELKDRETHRKQACESAEGLLAEGSAKQAYKVIETIHDCDLLQNQRQLRLQLEDLVSKENKIVELVKETKARRVFDVQSLALLYAKVAEYLALNPAHEKMVNLSTDLVTRLNNVPISDLIELQKSTVIQLPEKIQDKIPLSNSIGITLRLIPAGTFEMGRDNEWHRVTITKSFYFGIYPVTQDQYKRVMRDNPSVFKNGQNPVENVSWEDAVEFCARLSELPEEKAAGRLYRLPTEAEWEYACRAGSTSKYFFGDDKLCLGEYAWFEDNSGKRTQAVGQKKPNAWGLYDMHGNVWEWCSDWDGKKPEKALTDPSGPSTGSHRVNRGGSWGASAVSCRTESRNYRTPPSRTGNLGFRLAMSLSGKSN